MKPVLFLAAQFLCILLPAQTPWHPLPNNGLREFYNVFPAGDDLLAFASGWQLFRSTDGGQIWQKTPMPPALLQDQASVYPPPASLGASVYLVCRKTDIAAPDYHYLLRSSDAGQTWDKVVVGDLSHAVQSIAPYPDGLFLNKANGLVRLRGSSSAFEPLGPACTKIMYSAGKLWRLYNNALSVSADAGDTWTLVNAGMTVDDFAVKGDTVCMASSNTVPGLYRSFDAGKNWALATTQYPYPLSADAYGFYQSTDFTLQFSSDAFSSKTTVFKGVPGKMKGFCRQNAVLMLATESGLFRTTDSGANWTFIWQDIPSENLDISTLLNCCVFLPQASDSLLSVFGAATSGDGGYTWASNPNLPYFHQIVRNGDVYFAASGNALFRSPATNPPQWAPLNGMPGKNLFQMSGILLCTDADDKLWRSTDGGLSWAKASKLHTVHRLFVLGDSLYGMRTDTFQFYHSPDFGQSWTRRDTIPPAWYSGTAYDKVVSFHDKIYILEPRQYRFSPDRGISWKSAPYPFNTTNFYLNIKDVVANDLGLFLLTDTVNQDFVYLSPDDGQHWVNISQNLPPDRFEAMAWVDTALYVLQSSGRLWTRTDFGFVFDFLKGLVYYDLNTDGLPTLNEPSLPDILIVTATNQSWATSDSVGHYALFYGIVPDTVRPVKPSPYAAIQPAYHLLQANSAFQDFGISLPPGIRDLRFSLTRASYFLRNYITPLHIRVRNVGSVNAAGKVYITLDDHLEYVSAVPAPSQVNGPQITLPLTLTGSLKDRTLTVYVRTKPNAVIGDTVRVLGRVDWSVGTDLTPADNAAVLRDLVYSAYDPNDKSVTPGHYTTDSLADGVPLDYTVRFQNTGNFPATTVIIRDTISAKLDPAQFELVAASHPVRVQAAPGRVLIFRFDNIQLPDSTSDLPGSQGFVRFRLTPRRSLPAGDTIRNTAHIYFDLNDPIVTNTTETIIAFSSGTTAPRRGDFKLFPNPASDWLLLEKDDELPGRIRLISMTGQTLRWFSTKGSRVRLPVLDISTGFYFIEWKLDNGAVFRSKILVKQ